MFNPFRKKTELELLQKQFENLMSESYRLSTSNRIASDLKRTEAEIISQKIDEIMRIGI